MLHSEYEESLYPPWEETHIEYAKANRRHAGVSENGW